MLLLSGVRDEVVPREHMQALWEIVGRRQGVKAAEGNVDDEAKKGDGQVGEGRSKFVEFESGTHNDTCVQEGYWTTVAEFVASLGDSASVSRL